MISRIEFKNYKSFKAKQSIDLKPITILIGPNSAGKSSILKLLGFIVQSNKARKGRLFNWRGPLADLINFHESTYRHNDEAIELRVMSDSVPSYIATEELLSDNGSSIPGNVDISITIESDVKMKGKIGYLRHSSYEYSAHTRNDTMAEVLGERFYAMPSMSIVEIYGKYLVSSLKYISNWFNDNRESLRTVGSFDDFVRRNLIMNIGGDSLQAGFVPSEFGSPLMTTFQFTPIPDDLSGMTRFKGKDPEDIREHWKNLISIVNLEDPEHMKIFKETLHEYFRCLIYYAGKDLADYTNKCGEDISDLKEKVDRILSKCEFFPPLRDKPQEYYTEDELIKYTGRVDFQKEEFLRMMNYYLQLLGFEKELEIRRISDIGPLFQLMMRDKKTGHESSLTDVGYGYSQVLPMIFSKTRTRKTIILEQPELHLHPLAQGKLADLLITDIEITNEKSGMYGGSPLDAFDRHDDGARWNVGILGYMANQYIVETHSEHLLRRLQLKVAEGVLSAEDIAVYYVYTNKQGNGSIKPLKIKPNGFFEEQIPPGFYDSTTNLLEKLWEAQR
jgi:hypothetical protein